MGRVNPPPQLFNGDNRQIMLASWQVQTSHGAFQVKIRVAANDLKSQSLLQLFRQELKNNVWLVKQYLSAKRKQQQLKSK